MDPIREAFSRVNCLDGREETVRKLAKYGGLLREANLAVNLLSRKDMDDVEYRHIAFCAALGDFFEPRKGARIADVGSGGGLPGIVMAILYPQAKIDMFDGVGKKMAMVDSFIKELRLDNARAHHARIEEFKGEFDYAVGRSVCALPQFFKFVKRKLRAGARGNLSNGVIYFKGGDLEPELVSAGIFPDAEMDLMDYFGDLRFEGKKIVHFPVSDLRSF